MDGEETATVKRESSRGARRMRLMHCRGRTKLAKAAPLAVAIVTTVTGPAPAADLGVGMFAFDQGDYATALAEWTPLAESGDAMAQSLLGMMYSTGEGVGRDLGIAALWYERAATQGHPYAQYNLAEMYRAGHGVGRDLVRAYMLFALAAQQIPLRADGTNSASRARDALETLLTDDQLRLAQQQIAEETRASE